MQCPVCLSFGMTGVEATVQVEGTLYCPQHGVEAWANGQGQQRGNARRPVQFQPPMPVPPVVPVPPPTVASPTDS